MRISDQRLAGIRFLTNGEAAAVSANADDDS